MVPENHHPAKRATAAAADKPVTNRERGVAAHASEAMRIPSMANLTKPFAILARLD
jgi:hypothetical protein